MLAVRKDDHLNINTKMFEFEERILIGWQANSLRTSQSERVHQRQTFLLCQSGQPLLRPVLYIYARPLYHKSYRISSSHKNKFLTHEGPERHLLCIILLMRAKCFGFARIKGA